MPAHRAGDVILTVIVGVVVGGRLGYVLFYERELLWDFSNRFPWWGVLAINRGGMASHGGIIGVILASWRLSRGFKGDNGDIEGRCPPLHVMDVFALLSPIGLAFGRIANFVNGELLGRVVAAPGEPAPWWSVRYPQEVLSGHAPALGPEQTAALDALIDANGLPGEPWDQAYEGVLETLRAGGEEGARVAAELAPLLAARHPSQLYQAAAEGLVLGLVLVAIWAKSRRPGVVGAWFLIAYGALRIATEFYRLPDAHLQLDRWLGLSRGQWLSVLMVVGGAAALASVLRRGGDPIGGWAQHRDAHSHPAAGGPIQSAPDE